MVFNTPIGPIGQRKRCMRTIDRTTHLIHLHIVFRNKIGRVDKTPSRTSDSILLPPGGNGRLYGLVAVKDSCPNDGMITWFSVILEISVNLSLVNNVCGDRNDCGTGQLCLPNLSLRAKRTCQCADNAGLQCLLRERPPPPPPLQLG